MRKIAALIFGLIILFIPQKINADSSNFLADYSVTYTILDDALTYVIFDITLSNQTDQYYASSYNLQVGFKDIESVIASDSYGNLEPVVAKTNEGNSIEIIFNDKAVGLNKQFPFKISFYTRDIVRKSGEIWDINIPGLKSQSKYSSFDVKVIVPKFLGNPAYIKPNTGKISKDSLLFTKNDLGESGISISFGTEKIYNFDLSYHLKNSNLFPITAEIALPPSTNYQDVQITDINPKPINAVEDFDGNLLAQYKLSSLEKIDVKVKGKVRLMLKPKKEKLTEIQVSEYLKSQTYWQISKDIKDLALKLKTPHEIYKYVVKNLTYDFSRLESNKKRVGAVEILKNPKSAVCLEFTDLFIALARAAGIPAREINGFAYTQNSRERPLSLVKDVLHSWPEYYDFNLGAWIMVDPTWENTTGGIDYFRTLDFNHFAFVIKGKSSIYPIPAGGYKTSDSKTKDIIIKPDNNFEGSSFLTSIGNEAKIKSSKKNLSKSIVVIGGVLFGIFSISVFIFIRKSRRLSFFRRKR